MKPLMRMWRPLLALCFVACASLVHAGDARLHLHSEVRAGHADARSIWRAGDDAWLADAALTVRPLLEHEHENLKFIGHLEAVALVGDSRERVGDFASIFGRLSSDDETQLIDLSRTVSDGARHRSALRVDRLALVYSPSWGTVTLGRHAVTWGGGLVFNPFDLCNPFAPGDVIRDFKNGSDMLHVDVPWSDGGWQALAVGRRDRISRNVSADESSFALLANRTMGGLEWTGLAAVHFGEPVLGVGLAGEALGAAWRIDGVWARVRPLIAGPADDHVSIVANLQYAGRLFGRNAYGFLEYYYNGLGRADPLAAAADPLVQARFARGDLLVLGRHEMAASVQVEWHPLLQLFASVIANLDDRSLVLQPRMVWDASASLRLTAGLDLPLGDPGTEYGGYALPGDVGTTRSPASAYVLATWEF